MPPKPQTTPTTTPAAVPDPGLGINAGAPPAAGTTTGPSYIGIGSQYAPTPASYGGVPLGQQSGQSGPLPFNFMGTPIGQPQYVSGDEWNPANDPTSVVNLQAQLIEAGLLDPHKVQPGRWDTYSADAFKTVLSLANANGTNAQTALQYFLNQPGGPKRSSRTYALANPENVKADFQTAAEQLTGGDLPASEADKFLQQYQQAETAQQQATGIVDPSGSYTKPENPSTYIRQNDQGAMQQYNVLQRGLEFYRMLGVL